MDGDALQVLGAEYIGFQERTRGTETSQYPEERTSNETPSVAASERGPGLAANMKANALGSAATQGDSPVAVKQLPSE